MPAFGLGEGRDFFLTGRASFRAAGEEGAASGQAYKAGRVARVGDGWPVVSRHGGKEELRVGVAGAGT